MFPVACESGSFRADFCPFYPSNRRGGNGRSPDGELHSDLCQNRDPIANLGDRHGGPIRYETDFNTHFDPLIFIVPVGLDGVDIDRELPR